mgnify:CR=1 FL=1
MTEGVYVLEVQWCWDNFNTEYATITVEKPEPGFEDLFKKDTPKATKKRLLDQIKNVADAIDRSIMGKGRIVCLYRVEGENPGQKWVQKKEDKNSKAVNLNIRMLPVCWFDSEGNPTPTN